MSVICEWKVCTSLQSQYYQVRVTLPPFYKQCFDAWSDLTNNIPLSCQEVANEIIWNNKFLCVDKKSVFRRDLFSMGLLKIGDLISGNSTAFSFMNLLLNPEQSFFVMSIIDSIPAHWRTVIKEASFFPIIFPVSDAPTITIDGNSSAGSGDWQGQASRAVDLYPVLIVAGGLHYCARSVPLGWVVALLVLKEHPLTDR